MKIVCCQIWILFYEQYLGDPTTAKWISIANGYKLKAHIPNCVGAVDVKHIRVQKFPNSGSMNFNYKGYHSSIESGE